MTRRIGTSNAAPSLRVHAWRQSVQSPKAVCNASLVGHPRATAASAQSTLLLWHSPPLPEECRSPESGVPIGFQLLDALRRVLKLRSRHDWHIRAYGNERAFGIRLTPLEELAGGNTCCLRHQRHRHAWLRGAPNPWQFLFLGPALSSVDPGNDLHFAVSSQKHRHSIDIFLASFQGIPRVRGFNRLVQKAIARRLYSST